MDYCFLNNFLQVVDEVIAKAGPLGEDDIKVVFDQEILPKILQKRLWSLYSHLPTDVYSTIQVSTKALYLSYCLEYATNSQELQPKVNNK